MNDSRYPKFTWKQFLVAGVAILAVALAAAINSKLEDGPRKGQRGKDVLYIPTDPAIVEAMLDLAGLKETDFLVDLGSGDGRTVIAAAKRGARALGVELNSALVDYAKTRTKVEAVGDRAEFVHGDIFKIDFSKATVVTMFLLHEVNLKLRPAFLRMKPGTRIVSNTFKMGDWVPERSFLQKARCVGFCTVHLWFVPANVAGRWSFDGGTITFVQKFQELSGFVTYKDGERTTLTGKVEGARLRFLAGDVHYEGVVNGARILGEQGPVGMRTRWQATLNRSEF